MGSALFGWAPSPGMLTFVIGLGMIAGEFHFAARFLDWTEVRARKLWQFVTKVWHSSVAGKTLIVTATLTLISATVYIVYYLFFSG